MADLEFSTHKKSKKVKINLLKEELNPPDVINIIFYEPINLENIRKKRKFAFKLDKEDEYEEDEEVDVNRNYDYDYDHMLDRFFTSMTTKNPNCLLGERRKLVMQPPSLARIGTKKTLYANFHITTNQIRRDPQHVMQFLLNEMGTTGSLDQNSQLLIKGRYQAKQLESLLKSYCRMYVICKTCSAADTSLSKETRLLFLNCKACGSRYSVDSHTAGFQAVITKRAATRAKGL